MLKTSLCDYSDVYILVNPIQDGEEAKRLPTSFFTVTSLNVGIIPKNFLTFSFKSFATLV